MKTKSLAGGGRSWFRAGGLPAIACTCTHPHLLHLQDFREKNMDYMRPDIVALLRGSDSAYVRELIGMEPVAVFRWAVLRAALRAMAVMREAARLRAENRERATGRCPLLPGDEEQETDRDCSCAHRHSTSDLEFAQPCALAAGSSDSAPCPPSHSHPHRVHLPLLPFCSFGFLE